MRRVSPFPASTHLCLLLHWSTVNFGARNTPGAVPFAGYDVHQASQEYLDDNALDEICMTHLGETSSYLNNRHDSHNNENLDGILETTETIDQVA